MSSENALLKRLSFIVVFGVVTLIGFQNCSKPTAVQVSNKPSGNSFVTNSEIPPNSETLPPTNNLVGTELSKTIPFETVEFSNNHSCGISADNKTYCWGKDNYGELGNGTGIQSTDTPSEVSFPSKEFSLDVQVGGNFSCALVTSDPNLKDYTKNKIFCWGYSANGVLGRNPFKNSNGIITSVEVPTFAVVFNQPGAYPVQISGKGSNMCARLSDYTVWCWGQGDNGMLGNSTTVPCNINDPNVTQGGFICYKKYSSVPVQVKVNFTNGTETTQFQQVYSNSLVSCVRNGVSLFCWGDTYVFGPNIHSANEDHSVPKQIGSFVNFQNIFLGPYSFCMVGIGDGGLGYCRGDSNLGRLGNGLDTATDAKDKEILYNVKSNVKFKYIKTAMSKACGLSLDHQIYCWGNAGPQKTGLGVQELAKSITPVLSHNGEKFKNLSCSNNDLCGGQTESGIYIYW